MPFERVQPCFQLAEFRVHFTPKLGEFRSHFPPKVRNRVLDFHHAQLGLSPQDFFRVRDLAVVVEQES